MFVVHACDHNFLKKEVFEVLHIFNDIKSRAPNDFNFEFFKSFWKVMKPKVFALFDQFHQNECLSSYFTSCFTTLIPKANDYHSLRASRPPMHKEQHIGNTRRNMGNKL